MIMNYPGGTYGPNNSIRMDHYVAEKRTSRAAENVSRHRWLEKVLMKARDGSKRKKPLPSRMIKFFALVQPVIANGLDFTVEIFYELCLQCFAADDYRYPTVIKSLLLVCEQCGVSPDAFSAWLKEHGVTPPPQLLHIIRIRKTRGGRKFESSQRPRSIERSDSDSSLGSSFSDYSAISKAVTIV